MRFDEDLLPLAGRRVLKVHHEPGLDDGSSGCKSSGPIPFGNGCIERQVYLLNSNQLAEETTGCGRRQFAGVDMATEPQLSAAAHRSNYESSQGMTIDTSTGLLLAMRPWQPAPDTAYLLAR